MRAPASNRLPVLIRQSVCAAVAVALMLGASGPAVAYLKFGVEFGNQNSVLRWNRAPIRYFVTDAGVPGVSATDFRNAVDRAFDSWEAVPTASVRYEFAGFTSAIPFDEDGLSTLGFLDEPGMERVLGATSFLINQTTGEILESDVFFNAVFPWSVSASGVPGRFDVESIALHEIGHLSGLGHSAIGETEPQAGGGRRVIAAETVMFPIAFTAGSVKERVLRADDIAGISDIYPEGDFREATGGLTGRVRRNGTGVFGAHVVAFNLETGRLVGGFSVNERGEFSIAGLDPGLHVLRVEPLDDADVESFFQDVRRVDMSFRVTFFDRLVSVPRGGSASGFDVDVGAP